MSRARIKIVETVTTTYEVETADKSILDFLADGGLKDAVRQQIRTSTEPVRMDIEEA